MKNLLIAILLSFSFQLHAQIPDSLNIDLPWEIVNLPTCDATMGEGPRTEDNQIFIQLGSDSIYLDEDNECLLRNKLWEIIVWANGEVYTFNQIGKVQDFANTTCVTDLFIDYQEFPVELKPDGMLLDINPDHEYSFNYLDEISNSLIIDENAEDNFELFIYDLTDRTVCKTNVYVTYCEDDISLIFPEITEIEFNQEPYIELTLDLLGVEITYPCGTYTSKITIGNTVNNRLSSKNVGSVVPVEVVISFSDGLEYTKYIDVDVTGVKPDPISMFIEDLSFSAGETIALDIWSEEIAGLLGWQLQLEFENAEVLGIETSEMLPIIPINIIDNGSTIKALWFDPNGSYINVLPDATWFTLILKPKIDGSTFDIFNSDINPWSLILIEDENYIFEYEADFTFNVAPRDVLEVNNDPIDHLKIYPNPASNYIYIDGIENAGTVQIEVHDLSGALVHRDLQPIVNSDIRIDISNLPTGLFILKATSGQSIYTQKLIKI